MPRPPIEGSGAVTLTDVPVANDDEWVCTFTNTLIVNAAPTITSSATQSAAENQTAVATLTATDPDLPAQALTWSITGGADASSLSITSAGVLTFDAAPDFEAPGDANGDGEYVIDVQVSDGNGGETSQTVTVSVTNVNEAPVAVDDAYSVPVNVVLRAGFPSFGIDVAVADGVLTLGLDDADPRPSRSRSRWSRRRQ